MKTFEDGPYGQTVLRTGTQYRVWARKLTNTSPPTSTSIEIEHITF